MAVRTWRMPRPLAQAGYTLIELLTVIAITGILSLAAVQILLQGQLRSSQAEGVAMIRQEGNFVLDRITFELRNGLDAECITSQQLNVTTADGQVIQYTLNESAIASDSANLTTQDVAVQSLNFACEASSQTAGTLVKVNFMMTTPELQQTITDFSQDFSTSVYVRTVE